MLGLAVWSYQWIETPLRRGLLWTKEPRSVIGLSFLMLGSSLGILAMIHALHSRLFLGGNSGNAYQWSRLSGKDAGCKTTLDECRGGHSAAGNFFLWIGDSHVAHLRPLPIRLESAFGVQFSMYSSGGNAFQPFPVLRLQRVGRSTKEYAEESDRMRTAFSKAMNAKELSVIVISLNLPRYFAPDEGASREFRYLTDQGKEIDYRLSLGLWRDKLNEIVTIAEERGVKVILFCPTPHFPDFPGDHLCSIQVYRPALPEGCFQELDEHDMRNKWAQISHVLDQVKLKHRHVFFFDPMPALCSAGGRGICRSYSGVTTLYMDPDHLKREASDLIYPEFVRFLKDKGLLPADSANSR